MWQKMTDFNVVKEIRKATIDFILHLATNFQDVQLILFSIVIYFEVGLKQTPSSSRYSFGMLPGTN